MTTPNLATIPLQTPFLKTLARWWLDRGGDPSSGLFLLPTRRAARALEEAFLRETDGAPLLLPRITAIGAIDEAPLALEGALAQPQAVDRPRRLAVLTRMILAMHGRDGAPATADLAWTLAAELAALLDEAARAGVDLAAALPEAVTGDFAAHWNVTLRFLEIVMRAWPAWLAEQGLADVAAREIALLDAQEAAWRASPPECPVIAAGTTGAIPAVARLLRTVSRLKQGLVVLPGLDMALDAASWDALDETHPQAGLRTLLAALGARREDVQPWAEPGARETLLRQALLPAETLPTWPRQQIPASPGLSRLACRDQQEEAAAIALVLRDALEQPGATAALITPDRGLARRVATELLRYGVIADDSAGERLIETPAAVLLRLLAQGAVQGFPPVSLLSLLKHPLCAAGIDPVQCRIQARALERDALRGPRPRLAALRAAAPSPLLERLAACLAPLTGAVTAASRPAATLLRDLIAAAEALAATDTMQGATRLWAGEEGAALAAQVASLLAAFADLPPLPPAVLPGLLDAALAGVTVRSRRALRGQAGFEHPRVFIWGLLEARLQAADVAVLGGLVEGVWPPATDPGPWANRAMRQRVGLPSPEEAVGRAAHDFVASCCLGRQAVLSAPSRRGRAPTVPARWLVRLDALLRGQSRHLPAHPAAAWAGALDLPPHGAEPAREPQPRPPLPMRPRKLSVTEIETWLRDPYAIYARHVLRLRRLEDLEPGVDAADYGRVVHAGMANFVRAHGAAWPADAEAALCRAMDAALDAAPLAASHLAWWRPRLHRIAAWVAAEESARRAGRTLRHVAAESEGRWQIDTESGPFTLTGRADRIEQWDDGARAILDYKTGRLPTKAEIAAGLAPQMPLEAAMLQAGAFGPELAGHAGTLVYWRISGGQEPGQACTLHDADPAAVQAAAAAATGRLHALIAAYNDPAQPYLCRPVPAAAPRHGDYTRLARMAEWAETVDEADTAP